MPSTTRPRTASSAPVSRSRRWRRSCERAARCGLAFRRSDLDTETARGALALPAGTQSPQPLDEHRVGGERGGSVDQRVEHLVVARRRHVEQFADRLLLGAGVLPPLALEREDLAVAATEPVSGDVTDGIDAA